MQRSLSTTVVLSNIHPQSLFLENQAEDESQANAGGLECSEMMGFLCCVEETVFVMCELSCRAWWYRPRIWSQMTIVSLGCY